ncbi:integrator complex subunit 4 [Neocloeon triangulifer]|uniref:integrator complex subunit 4 n=1 Tax=Neocloeon triangulifer TaxID=2078957 RepID=UPI00286F1DFC|nr:integrator complex subunit 4 [Neocloeon triangulifer]
MAAVLKKRALAEYSHVIVKDEPGSKPLKRLRLLKRSQSGCSSASIAGYANLLDKCRASNDTNYAMSLLLRISDALGDQDDNTVHQQEDLNDTQRRLADHFSSEKESALRAKILNLMGTIGCLPGQDAQGVMDDIVSLLKQEESHKVITQGLDALLKLGSMLPSNSVGHQRLVALAKQYLCDTSHTVKCKCLEIIGILLPIEGTSFKDSSLAMLKLIATYTNYQEPRVRSAAFNAMIILHERGLKLDPSLYEEVCNALKDDYEIVRKNAMNLIWILASTYPDTIVALPGTSDQEIRLADDAFGKLSSCINDLSMNVRVQAAILLGKFGGNLVKPKFLQQTLDKKLMSNMRKKRSAHERHWESVTSGEWASGKKWADDAPREMLDAETVSLITIGACGAFVHGLEDEFMEVRSASVDSLCAISMTDYNFATMALEFLVDMFNDEIEEVRLKAIDSLTRISSFIVLREDQLETILGALEDFSIDVREGLHKMLAACKLSTKGCLQMCVESLLENLKKYPEDKRSTWQCLQKLGTSHPYLTLPLVPALLGIHPFLDLPEPDVEDPAYVCMLILVFNAAMKCPNMLQLFEEHTLRHYSYLRDTMPNLVPHLKLQVGASNGRHCNQELTAAVTHTANFMEALLERLECAHNTKIRAELLQTAQKTLARLANMDEGLSGASHFMSMLIQAHQLLNKLLASKLWTHPSALASEEGKIIKTQIAELLQICLRLQHVFVGHNDATMSAVRQIKLRALALQLVFTVRGSNASALAQCEHFLAEVEDVQYFMGEKMLPMDPFTSAVLRDLAVLEDAKPGAVARILLPLTSMPTGPLPRPDITLQMCSALILEPKGEADTALTFTAGLVLGVSLDAELYNLANMSALRVKVKYPDQTTQLLMPCKSDLRVSDVVKNPEQNNNDGPGKNFRLRTTVLLSHGVWTEGCPVDLSLVLDLSAPEASMGRRGDDSLCTLELCKPVTISISPKQVKKGF